MPSSNPLHDDLKDLLSSQNLNQAEVDQLASFTQNAEYEPGAVILAQGAENFRLFFLIEGTVAVFRDGERIATLSQVGDMLGEMSLITHDVCSATSQAETRVSCLVLDLTRIGELSENLQSILSHSLNRMFSRILARKLVATNEKARLFEITNRELEKAKRALEAASQNKIGQMVVNERSLFTKLTALAESEQGPIRDKIRSVLGAFYADQTLKDKHVLLAEDQISEQINAKMSLAGTGVELTVVASLEEAKVALGKTKFDIICVNSALVELIPVAKALQPKAKFVFDTSESIEGHLPTLKAYPELSTILSRHPKDRVFTIKNTATTVRKLMGEDIFGLQPYLSWGTDIHELKIASSQDRDMIADHVHGFFRSLGVRGGLAESCRLVAGELVMNAVYDAPTDSSGKAVYNHLDRRNHVSLKPEEQAVFRYACDGSLLALSAEDPFGALDRSTIINYLERCFGGKVGQSIENKGGGGNGLFQIILSSSLVVFNVRPKKKTEVIALFNTAMQFDRVEPHPSFHFFEMC